MSELRDIYDNNRTKTGRIKSRDEKLLDGEFFMAAYVCIFNKIGEMLIQKRQSKKKSWPNVWDFSVGGCAIVGESSQQTAEREMMEELGHSRSFTNIEPKFTINVSNGFYEFNIVNENINFEDLNLAMKEIEQVKWASKDEIFELLDKNEFIPYEKSLIEQCFRFNSTIQYRYV
jgi:isopentenyldiphosphate isomerase